MYRHSLNNQSNSAVHLTLPLPTLDPTLRYSSPFFHWAGGPAQYGAVVFDDAVLAAFSNASALDAEQLLALLPLLAAAAPGRGDSGGPLGGLPSKLGLGLAPLAWLASPEARVASSFITRMQTYAC